MDIIDEMEKYLKINPNLLNNEEKNKTRQQLLEYARNPKGEVDDLLMEFFVYFNVVKDLQKDFLNYIMEHYPPSKFPKVLEVAAGKVCNLGQQLKRNGYKVTSIDPNIRIASNDPRVKGIKLLKRKFTPDFSVLPYDVIVGYNACPTAGNLLKINKRPTVFTICDRPETDGKLDIGVDIKSKQEFINELEKRNGCVKQIGQLTIVDNSRVLEVNDLSCDQRENH